MTPLGTKNQSKLPESIYILGIVLVICVIVAQTWWSVREDKFLTLRSAQENHKLFLRILEEHASRTIHDAIHALNAVAIEVGTETGARIEDAEKIQQVFSTMQQNSSFIISIALINTAGERWISSTVKRRVDLSSNEIVKDLLSHPLDVSIHIDAPAQGSDNRQKVISIMRNFVDHEGRHLGIVQLEVSTQYLSEFYERIAQQPEIYIALVTRKGEVLSATQFSKKGLAPAINKELMTSLAKPRIDADEWGEQTKGEIPSLLSFKNLPDLPFTLIYVSERKFVLNEWQQRFMRKILLLGLTLSLILLMSVILVWQLQVSRTSQRKLAASESRYRILFEDAHDAIVLIDQNYQYVDANQAALNQFSLTDRKELLGRRVGVFAAATQQMGNDKNFDKDTLMREMVDRAFAGENLKFEWILEKNHRPYFCEVSLNKVELDGEPYLFSMIRDIHARKLSEKVLEGQNILLHLIATEKPLGTTLEAICKMLEELQLSWRCGLLVMDDERKKIDACFGTSIPEKVRQALVETSLRHTDNIWTKAILEGKVQETQNVRFEAVVLKIEDDEVSRHFRFCSAWPVAGKGSQGDGCLCVFSENIDALDSVGRNHIRIALDMAAVAIDASRSEKKILQLAHYDELTGLPNRFLYNQHLARSLRLAERHQRSLAVFFLDLDRFKNINDTFGHDAGDRVLKTVSANFKAVLRQSDIIARVGGDEFILLVDNFQEMRDLSEIAAKLLFEACKPFEISGQECQLSASIGIATYPTDGRDAQTLMKNADIAMYRAKNNGKNNFQFYASEMNVHTVERLAFEGRLRKAIERREFVVHYQPKVDVASGVIVGAEALVRWSHPERGLLYPDDFIGLAEEAGLIGRLGMLVLDIACHDILNFREIDPDFGRVAVNLSGSQFNQNNLIEEVKNVLDFWRVTPNLIEFEITENTAMSNFDQTQKLMDAFRMAGYALSIDDFGTGYSSLAYLKSFPIDNLKIDRSFVKDIPADPNDTAIVKAIVAMGHSLGKKVIAEGVDSLEQLEVLAECGCDTYQGFYFSRAIPQNEFIQLLKHQTVRSDTAYRI